MALIKTWPESTSTLYDNKQWEWNEWAIGTPITQGKLENLENGVGILATQIKAILGEFNPSSLDGAQLNASRLDKVQEWITGDTSGTYSNTTSITSRLDNIATEVWGSNTTTGTSRIDKNENKIAAIATELGGTAPDGSSTTYGGTTRLDSVITEVWGSNTTSGDSRIDTLKSTSDTHTNELTAIKSELGGTISGSAYGGTTRLDSVITEVWGSNTISGDSRLDKTDNKIAAIAAELGGTAPDGTSTTYSGTTRLDTVISKASALATELFGSDTTSGTSRIDKNDNKIAAIAAELGGTAPDGTSTTYSGTTRLDSVITKASSIATEVWGTDTTSGDSRIDKLTTELYGSNVTDYTAASRLDSIINKVSTITTELYGSDNTSVTSKLDDLEKEIGGTRTTNGTGYTSSRIDSLESTSTSYGTRLTDIENKNTVQDNKLTAIMNELGGTGNDGSNTTYGGTSRLDSAITKLSQVTTELYGSDSTSVTSRLDDLEKEVGGTRTSNGTGYTNSRIDTLESTSTSYGTRLTNIETKNTAQDNKFAAIMSELGGTGNDGTNTTYGGTTRLDTVITEVWGSNTTSGNSRLDNIETHDASVDKAIAAIKNELGGTYVENSGFTNSRIDAIEVLNTTQNNRLDTIETLNTTQNNRLNTLTTEIYGSNDTSVASRLDDLEKEICGETITRTENGGYNNSRIDGLELKVGNGAIGIDSDISAAIRRLSDTVVTLDPTGSAEATSFLVSEVWGQSFSENTDFTANSRIDNLETTTQNLGTQLTTLATEQNELEQNLAAINEKISIEMYIATNNSASDTIVLNAAPRDKSIFFIAIPRGTLGTNNLTLQTPDIQFNNVLINRIYNGSGMKIKYSAGSLISIYRNGTKAYAYNVPMVL